MNPRPTSHTASATSSSRILAGSSGGDRVTPFPDMRNAGVLARALIVYIAMLVAYAIATGETPLAAALALPVALAFSLPVAFSVICIWLLANSVLRQLAYWQATTALAIATVCASALAAQFFGFPLWRANALSLFALGCVIVYFYTLGRALSPALVEARLQALQARIRPHFLFNAINGVLGVLRHQPRRAEQALEDLADLFRALMRDTKGLHLLRDEIVLTRQYLDLEQLRLGDRLKVKWLLDKAPSDALVPALILQPIAENAVYHGIEPANSAGEIEIEIARNRSEVLITVRNPFVEASGSHHGGNKMAMGNIRERLALHFDAEARFVSGPRDGRWQVQIAIPYRRENSIKDTRTAL